MALLEINDLSVRYGGIKALNSINVAIEAKEIVILVGANGAGKSSILNSIMGLVKPQNGTVLFKDNEIYSITADKRARLGIGYSPEGRRVFPSMSVRDNVLSGLIGSKYKSYNKIYNNLVEYLPMLHKYASRSAGLLSGGEQQLVAIARAVARSPNLLLLDEPFLGLSPIWIKEVSNLINLLRNEGMAILLAEQMAIPAMKLADRGYILKHGSIVKHGNIEEIKTLAISEEFI